MAIFQTLQKLLVGMSVPVMSATGDQGVFRTDQGQQFFIGGVFGAVMRNL
jgi:hypothetical protein